MKTFVGVDLGTSGVKVLLVDGGGKIIKEVSESYPIIYPKSGWAEQNPEDWFKATLSALKKLNTGTPAGISFGGQMHGLVVLDENDKVVRPCILWNDGRSQEEVGYLNTLPVAEWTGNIAFAGFTAPKILWLKKHEPNNFARIAKIMLPKDYLVYKFSGAFVTDYSDASGTLLLDVKNKCWNEQMCGICGISRGQLPGLCESFTAVGTLNKDICSSLGWGKVAVIAGAGDNAAAAIGTGTTLAGDTNISVGTSGTIFIANDKFSLPKNNALHSFTHANGNFHLMGCILSAASANLWWIENILQANYDLPEKSAHLLGKNGVYFLPYLMGERCPHNDPAVRGAFLGLSADTSREQMSLAVLEGVAFAFRDCLELAKESGVNISRSTVCGGGAKSKLWRKIIANVLNLELQTVETEQGPAFGAAILAMVGCGEYENVQSAVNAIVKKTTVERPDPALVAAYNERYTRYKKLYPLLKQWK